MRANGFFALALSVSSLISVAALAQPLAKSGIVVRSRALITVEAGAKPTLLREAMGTQPVTVINAPNTSMTLDNSKFNIPIVSNIVLNFGSLAVSGLFDNNLDVCGPNNNQRCNTALIRTYTTGTAGPGVYNVYDGYGTPLTVNSTGSAVQTVGLEVANAIIMQSFAINTSRHTVNLGDFGAAPIYFYNSDFTDAGAGAFSTTIVIEYALAP